jgi:hypothetical protein
LHTYDCKLGFKRTTRIGAAPGPARRQADDRGYRVIRIAHSEGHRSCFLAEFLGEFTCAASYIVGFDGRTGAEY